MISTTKALPADLQGWTMLGQGWEDSGMLGQCVDHAWTMSEDVCRCIEDRKTRPQPINTNTNISLYNMCLCKDSLA